jgi:hypothetical protein
LCKKIGEKPERISNLEEASELALTRIVSPHLTSLLGFFSYDVNWKLN